MKIEVSIVADDAHVLSDKSGVEKYVTEVLQAAGGLAYFGAKMNAAKQSFESDCVTIRVKTDTAFCELVRSVESKKTNRSLPSGDTKAKADDTDTAKTKNKE